MNPFDRLHPAIRHHVVNSLGWSALRPTQEEAIDPILRGQDVLLLAPTAGGKTEAAVFPVLSRMLSERWLGLSVLYICPLRALLNNLESRLAYYAGLLGRSVALWHGDVGAGKKRTALRSPPDLLMTTPESIESILISRSADHNDFFSTLRVIIVDELHVFAGDDRGWHLLALLERLDRITERHIQRLGLSATVGNPEALASWLTREQRPARVVGRLGSTPDGKATIDYVGSLENAALVISRMHRGEKRLVFCDSRARVERLASRLRGLEMQTFVCHSSLSATERRHAEEAFAQASDCVIVATSALELGIDVGDLDRVIQIDAPPTVASFLQRMGRTGRRAGSSRNCLFLATTNESLLIAAGLVRLWSEGFVEHIVPSPRPLHIFAQQILALVLQQRGLPENSWSNWVGETFEQVQAPEARALVGYMISTGVLTEDQGVLGIGPLGETSLGRRNFLELMSAFTTPLLLSVRHGNTVLGEVAPTTIATRRDEPMIVLLGGRSWYVTEVDWKRRLAWVEPSEEGGRSMWPGSSRFIPYASCRAIEAAVVACALSVELSNRAKIQFDALCDEFAFCDGVSIPLVVDPNGRCRLWTFAGSAVNGPLTRSMSASGLQIERFDNFGISIKSSEPSLIPSLVGQLDPGECLPSIPDDLRTALKFSMCLPPGVASAILTERLRDKTGLAATMKRPVRIVCTERQASA